MRLPLDTIGELINPPGETWREMMDHDTLDEFWKAIRYDDLYDQIDVPCLHVTGWYDLEDLLGAFHHYEGMMAQSPAKAHQRIIAGPWSHVMTRLPHHTYGGVYFGETRRWIWIMSISAGSTTGLREKKTARSKKPPVQLFEPGTNVWRDADHWPLATAERRFISMPLREAR